MTDQRVNAVRDRRWLIHLVLALEIGGSLFAAFFLRQINGIVHGTLYNYGLQFSDEWAVQYWNTELLVYICLLVPSSIAGLALVVDMWRSHREKTLARAPCVEERIKPEAMIPLKQKKIDMKIETRKPEIAEQVWIPDKKSSRPAEAEKPQITTGNHEKLWIAAEPPTPKATKKSRSPLKAREKVISKIQVKPSNECLEGCPNFLGYLNSLPNGTLVPPSCYSCLRRVDCHMRVRAIISVYYVEQNPANTY